MKKQKKLPNNVIRVNFRNKEKPSELPDMKSLYPDAFAMVDTESDHPDKFSQAVIDALDENKPDK